jgi:hypothetical protein
MRCDMHRLCVIIQAKQTRTLLLLLQQRIHTHARGRTSCNKRAARFHVSVAQPHARPVRMHAYAPLKLQTGVSPGLLVVAWTYPMLFLVYSGTSKSSERLPNI